MRKIKVYLLLIVCLLSGLSYPSFLLAEETTTTFAAELTDNQVYEQGLSYLKTKQFKKARETFHYVKILTKDTEIWKGSTALEKVSYFCEQGQIYYNSENYKGALEYFTLALNAYPDSPDAFFARGETYFAVDDYQKAIADYTKAIELSPNNAEVYVSRSIAYGNLESSQFKDKDFKEIYIKKGYGDVNVRDLKNNDFRKALELDPNLVEHIANRGLAYYNNQDYDLALSDFNKVILIDPNNIRCNYALGLTYLQKAKGDNAIAIAYKALACFENVIKLDPDAKESELAGNLMKEINMDMQKEENRKLAEEYARKEYLHSVVSEKNAIRDFEYMREQGYTSHTIGGGWSIYRR